MEKIISERGKPVFQVETPRLFIQHVHLDRVDADLFDQLCARPQRIEEECFAEPPPFGTLIDGQPSQMDDLRPLV